MTTVDADVEKGILKTLWDKEKMLVTSIFSFSYNVFYPNTEKFNGWSLQILSPWNKAEIMTSAEVLKG